MNYFADVQRQSVRESNGQALVWGKKPAIIIAEYQTDQGEIKKNILLASGFWGLSRHFRYLPEVLMSLCWTIPAGFTHALPYFYVVFLSILLVHRAFRDDERCAKKYGKYWDEYCKRVPSKIVPWVY